MAMRHVRNPIDGSKMSPDTNEPTPRPTFRSAASKVVYINMMQQPPPPTQIQPPPPPRAPSPVRNGTATSVSQVQYTSRSPSPPPPTSKQPGGPMNNVVFINHNSPTPRWPSPRGRSPSPHRSQKPTSMNKPYGPHQNSHGYHSRYTGGNNHGSAYHTGKTYQGAHWPQRRCCTLLWAILLILLLAALAAGIYFLVKYINDQKAATAQDVVNPGGTYVNGLYIITSTYAPSESQGIFGHDRACNPFNNNTAGDNNITNPDCNTLTTRIVPINFTTTTTIDPIFLTTIASAHIVSSGVMTLLISFLFYSVTSIFS